MRTFEFRQRQIAKRKRWATRIVARWADPASSEGRRKVGKIARTHTFCGCFYCRRAKLERTPTLRRMRSDAADVDALGEG